VKKFSVPISQWWILFFVFLIVIVMPISIGIYQENRLQEMDAKTAEQFITEKTPLIEVSPKTKAEEYFEKSIIHWEKVNSNTWGDNWDLRLIKIEYYLNLAIYYQNQEIIELLKKK